MHNLYNVDVEKTRPCHSDSRRARGQPAASTAASVTWRLGRGPNPRPLVSRIAGLVLSSSLGSAHNGRPLGALPRNVHLHGRVAQALD